MVKSPATSFTMTQRNLLMDFHVAQKLQSLRKWQITSGAFQVFFGWMHSLSMTYHVSFSLEASITFVTMISFGFDLMHSGLMTQQVRSKYESFVTFSTKMLPLVLVN